MGMGQHRPARRRGRGQSSRFRRASAMKRARLVITSISAGSVIASLQKGRERRRPELWKSERSLQRSSGISLPARLPRCQAYLLAKSVGQPERFVGLRPTFFIFEVRYPRTDVVGHRHPCGVPLRGFGKILFRFDPLAVLIHVSLLGSSPI